MSFSFNVTGNDKAEARKAVIDKVAEIAEQQSAHKHDQHAVVSVVDGYLDLIDEQAEGAVHVSVSGSVSWNETGADGGRMRVFTGASVNVAVRKVPA